MMRKLFSLAVVLVVSVALTGCGRYWVDIPAGHVGKVLTPSGWQEGVLEAGQVNLGRNWGGSENKLVLLEATSVTIKEQFAGSTDSSDSEDHRIITLSNAPIAVDVYNQVIVPEDEELRESIFLQVTPEPMSGQDRVSIIRLSTVYERFAKMTIRGKAREIFAPYDDYTDVMANYSKINDEVGQMVATVFEENNVPLQLISCQLSNVKADKRVWDAENERMAATAEVESIEMVGEALQSNPGFLEKFKWETLEKIAKQGGTTIIVNDAGDGMNYTIPTANPSARSQ